MKFDIAFKYLMDNEGGFSNDPVDVGGKTIYGIASRYHKEWFDLVYKAYKSGDIKTAKKLTEQFYKLKFWNDKYNYIEDSSLAFRLFDFGVNAGVKKSVKIFQRSINFFWREKLKVDGVFGDETLIISLYMYLHQFFPKALHPEHNNVRTANQQNPLGR